MSFHLQRLSSSLSSSSSSEDWSSLKRSKTTAATTANTLMEWNNTAVVLLQHNKLKPASRLLKHALTELKNQSKIMIKMMASSTIPETQDPCEFSSPPSCSSCLSPSFVAAASSSLPPLMSVHESMSDMSFSNWTCDSQEESDETQEDEDDDEDDKENEKESMYSFSLSLLSVPVLTSQLSSLARPEDCAPTSLLSMFDRALYLDYTKDDAAEAIDEQESNDLHLMAVTSAVLLYNMALVQHVRGLLLLSTRSTNTKSSAQGAAGIPPFTKYFQRARYIYQTSFQIIQSLSSTSSSPSSSSANVFDLQLAILSPTDTTLFLLALLNNMSHIDSFLWFVFDIHPPLPLVDAGDDEDHYESNTMQCHLNHMHAILQRIALDGIEPTSISNYQEGHPRHQLHYHNHDVEFQWFYTNIVVPTVMGLLVRSLAPAA